MQWKKKQPDLAERYLDLWRFHSYHMVLSHISMIGVIAFMVLNNIYQSGDIGWFWPAFSLAIAFIACLALFIPGESDNEPWR